MEDENLLKPLWKVYELNCLVGVVKAKIKQWSLKIKNKRRKKIKVKVINEDVKITYNNIMLEMSSATIAYFRNKAIKIEERKMEERKQELN